MEHGRLTLVTADPAAFGTLVRYVEDEARPIVEGRLGSLGMSMDVDPRLGVALVASYWASGDAMRDSEHSVAATRSQAFHRGAATVSVERHQLASFLRIKPAEPGAGVQLTRFETRPNELDAFVTAYEDVTIPWLTEADGLRSAILFVDRQHGRCIARSIWRDGQTLSGQRGRAAQIRADTVAATDSQVSALEEFVMSFSTARPA